MHFHDHGLSPLLMQKSLFKIHFDHKNFICSPILKFFAGPIRTKNRPPAKNHYQRHTEEIVWWHIGAIHIMS